MDFILRFFGIITMACLPTHPCAAKPYQVQVFIPDGTSPRHPCVKQPKVETPIHEAYVVLRTKPINDTAWAKWKSCGTNCRLYYLDPHDEIYIKGISDGGGMTDAFKPHVAVRWKTVASDSTITHKPPKAAFAWMTVKAGMMITSQAYKENKNFAFVTIGTFPNQPNEMTIETKGDHPKKLVVSSSSVVDICNLPPDSELHDPEYPDPNHPSSDKDTHFFLHYTLADKLPDKCHQPIGGGPDPDGTYLDKKALLAKGEKQKGRLNANIHCSNSTFP